MHRTSILAIPQPCSASWAAMTPDRGGRHCNSCQKTVVDFTAMTDPEILAYLGQSSGGTCGRFRAGQLARPLRPVALAPARRWQAWVATLATVLGLRELLASEARAQEVPVEQTVRRPLDMKRNRRVQEAPPAQARILRGQVVEGTEPLPGVTILIEGSMLGTNTNAYGTFELELPASLAADTVTVLVRYVGYEGQKQKVGPQQHGTPLLISLKPDTRWMGEVVVTQLYRVLPPAPWRPRALYGWGKYWLTRPFRRY